ncbi:hypothetical protein, partial [Streptomyces lunaelactis]|uniref:hypothetical protein n=1 Tax=Streptomyces lunaelactis TaxID=1535768 RepID=UPI001585AD98
HSNLPGQLAFAIDFNEDQDQVVDWLYEDADAKLIAAAPDLLAELTILRDTLPHVGLPAATRVELLRRIDSAIAKATQ